MSIVWRRIRRSNKKSAKYRFTITPQELLIVCANSEQWKPNRILVACLHRRRRVEGRSRQWEGSFADACRGLIVWPVQTPDPLLVETTLYGDNTTREYDDKEWTLLIEECTTKGKKRSIAAVNLNMRLFVQNTPGTSSEVKLKMRPLWSGVAHCSIQILITSALLNVADSIESEVRSETSSVRGDGRGASVEHEVDAADGAATMITSQKREELSNDTDQWNKTSKSLDDSLTSPSDQSADHIKKNDEARRKVDDNILSGKPFAEAVKEQKSNAASNQQPSSIISAQNQIQKNEINKKTHPFVISAQQRNENTPIANKAANRLATTAISYQKVEPDKTDDVKKSVDKVSDKLQVETTESLNGNDILPIKNESKEVCECPSRKVDIPEVIEGEDLLSWCQRVAQGYHQVRITDFSKSFRSGLALCTIIHRYHPEMIGPFQSLDFSDSHSGRRENCRKALNVAAQLGVTRKLDAGITVTLPDRHEIQLFLTDLRSILEGGASSLTRQMSTKESSDHRISALFNLSESETSVMRELESLRKQREQEDAIDLTNIPAEDRTRYDAVAPGSTSIKTASLDRSASKQRRHFVNPFDSDSDSDENKLHQPTTHNRNASVGAVLSDKRLSPVVKTRHEELMKKRREIFSDDDHSSSQATEQRAKRLQQEARRLLETAATEGTTVFISESAPGTTNQSPAVANVAGGNTPSTSNIGLRRRASQTLVESLQTTSQNELRCLAVTTPQVNIYKFKKIQPSPILQRKKYEAPLIPAFERPTQRISNSQSDIRNESWPSAFDRVKRYGSMRGQELADTVARMAGITMAPAIQQTSNTSEATPTRKLVSQWEKDSEKMQEEQANLSARLAQVSAEDEKICTLIKRTKASSEEEERLLREHMRLLNEKDALVRRSEYFNVLEQLKDVQDEIGNIQKKLSSASSIEQEDKTEEDKQNIDRLMNDLVELVNRKDQLSQKLIHHEAEDEEFDERDRLTLEAAANFSRGFEQPMSASKRLFTWIRSEISS